MNENAVPTDTFTMKADVASSEGAFNVVLSMLYNDLCPYKTPAQEEDPKIRQCIEGFPCVIFWDYGDGPVFLGKYNFNNDKGTSEVFGFKSGDESWETLQNGTDRVGWHSADFSGDGWKTDFEARYPEDNTDTTRLQALAEWLVSTDTAQATGNAITAVTYDGVEYTTDTVEYRLAKFSAELADHFIEDAIIFYYLFTEIFLSIDQREKNAFPTYLVDEDRWIVLFYDADSSCGTDNKGNLAFDYYLEDIDYTEGGEPIYNGQNSVLWKNLRATRYDEIMAMYQQLRTDNLISYEFVINKFMTHQGKWPEAIFNEDMYTKCIEPLVNDGDGEYLPMLQGKKEQWMKWWLYNRFRYLDSKYETGTSKTNYIKIRARSKANVHLTSYVNMYGHVYYNAERVEHRMERNQEYEFVWAASGAEDAVIGVYDGDMITSLGDLSPLIAEEVNVSVATHLTELKIGDSADDYRNYSLNSVTLGNNTLLRTLDVRNCPNLTAGPDMSGCTNVESVYFDGTSITGLKLPNGGILKTLHLPATIANLTVINQPQLTDFVLPSYSQITTLRLENAGVLDGLALDILNEIPENSRVRILGINLECTAEEALAMCDRLDTMRGLDESGNNMDKPQVSGTMYIPTLTGEELYKIQSRYPAITVIYNELTLYTVRFWNGDTLLQTVTDVMYNAAAEYSGEDPIKDGETDNSRWAFTGWSPAPSAVTGDMDCYAQFKFTGSLARELVQRTIEGDYANDRVTSVGVYAFAHSANVTSVDLANCTSIDNFAFNTMKKLASFSAVNYPGDYTNDRVLQNDILLETVYMPNCTAIGLMMFYGCTSLHDITFSQELTTVNASAFWNCTSLEEFIYPNAKLGSYSVFSKCTSLKKIDIDGWSGSLNTNSIFSDTASLEALIIRSDTLQPITKGTEFTGSSIESGTGYIYVPAALVDSYKAATNWATYAAQIRAIENYPDICGGDA